MKNIKTLIAIGAAGLMSAPVIAAETERSFPAVDDDQSGQLTWYEAMQVQQFHHHWSEMDRNGDLRIDAAEYRRFVKRQGIRTVPVSTASNSPFGSADANGDGYLDWVEVNSNDALRYRWHQLDRNDDVRVDSNEYQAYRNGDRSL